MKGGEPVHSQAEIRKQLIMLAAPVDTRLAEVLHAAAGPQESVPEDILLWRKELGGVLSQREQEILILVAQGLSNTEVAKQLFISEKTVRNHLSTVLRKVGAENRQQAVIYAVACGWVEAQQATL